MASTMTPQSSNLPSLEDVLRIYFQRLESMMECSHDILTVGRNLVKNLKRENASNTVIFHELSGLFPNVGCPLVQYHKVDNSYIAAQRSEHAVRREAREVATRADAEFVNKRQCIEAERKTQREQTLATNLTSPPCSTSNKVNRHQSAIRPGQYVLVSQDLSPGKFSHGGEAWVLAVHGSQGSMVCDVEYIKCTAGNRTRGEKAVPLSRLTLKNCAWHAAQLSCNKRGSKRLQEQMTTPPPEKQTSKDSKPLKDILSLACQSGMSNGWRAREIGFNACASKQNARFRDCFRRDLAELKGFLSAVPKIRMHSERGRDGSWKVRRQQHNPFTIKYLQYAWGVGVHYANNLVSLEHDVSVKEGITAAVKSSKCVIDNRAAARAWYTPQRLFIDKQVHVRHAEAEMLAYESRKAKNYEWTEEAKAEWVLLDASVKEEWIFHARNHDERQPYIRDQIIQAIQRSPTKSFDKIAADIDHWCSASTIHKWLSSHDSYSVYVERILPLLTRIQMQKHIDFAKLVRDHWGLNTRGKKFLWVHFDEKWFYGWLCRANAKKCEQLGLEKNLAFLYHKSHIDKTMVIAVTGYAFEENIENGGHGLKIMMHRVQGARIAKKRVRAGRKTQDGQQVYDGDVVREKGDVYMVDCNVTGSDIGTSDKPKFSLKEFFEHSLFPRLLELVGDNGKYEGYIPIIQGDNAGPHQDRSLVAFCRQYCETKGWIWQPQAPQMPHMNNLDLAVFPSMSRRHADLLRSRNGNRMADPEKVWSAAKEVWDELPSATIARGFILAFRIAQKVIGNKGSNGFLQGKDGSLHSDVRRDFYDTAKGIKKKNKVEL